MLRRCTNGTTLTDDPDITMGMDFGTGNMHEAHDDGAKVKGTTHEWAASFKVMGSAYHCGTPVVHVTSQMQVTKAYVGRLLGHQAGSLVLSAGSCKMETVQLFRRRNADGKLALRLPANCRFSFPRRRRARHALCGDTIIATSKAHGDYEGRCTSANMPWWTVIRVTPERTKASLQLPACSGHFDNGGQSHRNDP